MVQEDYDIDPSCSVLSIRLPYASTSFCCKFCSVNLVQLKINLIRSYQRHSTFQHLDFNCGINLTRTGLSWLLIQITISLIFISPITDWNSVYPTKIQYGSVGALPDHNKVANPRNLFFWQQAIVQPISEGCGITKRSLPDFLTDYTREKIPNYVLSFFGPILQLTTYTSWVIIEVI